MGLALTVDKYVPVARQPGERNILAILIGNDQPGRPGSAPTWVRRSSSTSSVGPPACDPPRPSWW